MPRALQRGPPRQIGNDHCHGDEEAAEEELVALHEIADAHQRFRVPGQVRITREQAGQVRHHEIENEQQRDDAYREDDQRISHGGNHFSSQVAPETEVIRQTPENGRKAPAGFAQ